MGIFLGATFPDAKIWVILLKLNIHFNWFLDKLWYASINYRRQDKARAYYYANIDDLFNKPEKTLENKIENTICMNCDPIKALEPISGQKQNRF